MLKYKKAWMLKKKKGSNQYQVKYNNWLIRFLLGFFILLGLVVLGCIWYEREMAKPIISPVPEGSLRVKEIKAAEPYIPPVQLEGIATWYGSADSECLGCRKDRLMANGKKLDDTALIVACGVGGSCKVFPLGSKVKIINLENMMTVEAVVSDTGGFAKYNRILDVTKAVRDRLNMAGMARVRVIVQ